MSQESNRCKEQTCSRVGDVARLVGACARGGAAGRSGRLGREQCVLSFEQTVVIASALLEHPTGVQWERSHTWLCEWLLSRRPCSSMAKKCWVSATGDE